LTYKLLILLIIGSLSEALETLGPCSGRWSEAFSEEVETLAHFLLHGILLTHIPLVGPQVHEQLSDLVRIHARRGDFNRTGPVVVVVTELESQLLDGFLLHL